ILPGRTACKPPVNFRRLMPPTRTVTVEGQQENKGVKPRKNILTASLLARKGSSVLKCPGFLKRDSCLRGPIRLVIGSLEGIHACLPNLISWVGRAKYRLMESRERANARRVLQCAECPTWAGILGCGFRSKPNSRLTAN